MHFHFSYCSIVHIQMSKLLKLSMWANKAFYCLNLKPATQIYNTETTIIDIDAQLVCFIWRSSTTTLQYCELIEIPLCGHDTLLAGWFPNINMSILSNHLKPFQYHMDIKILQKLKLWDIWDFFNVFFGILVYFYQLPQKFLSCDQFCSCSSSPC